jgi:hypothetical protein
VTTSRRSARPLVITSKAIDAEAIGSLEEDLNVMYHIMNKEVEKEVGPEGPESAMGIILSPTDNRTPNAMYLDGYGALFFLNVRFPLLAPPTRKERKEPVTADSSWEKAKRELYGNYEAADDFNPGEGDREFDAKNVEQLKQAVLRSLKNANNIRGLRADENVTVTVFGGSAGGGPLASVMSGLNQMETSLALVHSGLPMKYSREAARSGRASVMTLRAKKSDIEALAKGKMEFEDFRQRAAIQVYATSQPASVTIGKAVPMVR